MSQFPRPFIIVFIALFLLSFPFSNTAEGAKRKAKGTLITNPTKKPASIKKLSSKAKSPSSSNQKRAKNKKIKKTKKVTRTASLSIPRQEETPVPSVPDDQIAAKSFVVLDSQTGDLLFAQNPDAPRQPASTIKVLTAMLAIRNLRDSELVPASSRAVSMPPSKINLQPGRYYRAEDLIHAVLLASANDASVAVAEKVAGTEYSFARLMTNAAKALGAQNTVCKTATGLTADGQRTTARDLATIFNQAMKQPEFAQILQLREAKTQFGTTLRSHNKALWQIDGNVGGKTGYTCAAKKTYVGQFKRGDDELVVALMGTNNIWPDLRALVEQGFEKKRQLKLLAQAQYRQYGRPAISSADGIKKTSRL